MKRDNSIPVQSDQMLELCKELWKDYQTRIVDYESLQIESYTRKFEVTKFPKALIAPILLKRTEPISDDAKSLRVERHTIKRYEANNLIRFRVRKAGNQKVTTGTEIIKCWQSMYI
jgi:hypothetical protein